MKTIETRSTSRSSAGCNPIVLREGEQVRLVFMPTLVDNLANPKASVDGHFIYQRKAKSGRWFPVQTVSLSSLKSGEEFKLRIHADELLRLLEGLVPLYKFYEQEEVPRGQKTFVQVDRSLAKFVAAGKKDLTEFLESHPDHAPTLLLNLVKWLATSTGRREAAAKLVSLAPEQMPAFTALLGLAAVKDALSYWRKNESNDSEQFWQNSFAERVYVLKQLFPYPVVLIGAKAFVGGKQLDNRGGKEIDFLLGIETTDALIMVEIKTPKTQLLGPQYRDGVYPLSRDLSGALAQILNYRQSLLRKFDSLTAQSVKRLTLGEPRCVVIAGHSGELGEAVLRENFELHRERLNGVTIITFDELFLRLDHLIRLLEEPF